MATVDQVNFDDAEEFKLPSAGVHNAVLAAVEYGQNKKGDREQFMVTVNLAADDPDAPNLPMRVYIGWPDPEDKDIMWGSRTAYGAKVKALKDLMTAFGGPESGPIDRKNIEKILTRSIGKAVKVKVKVGTDDNGEMRANADALLPAQ